MTDNDYKQIKDFMLTELKKLYTAPTVNLWFENMRVVSLVGNSLIISFSKTKLSFVESQYYNILKQKFSEIIGIDVDLTIISDEEEQDIRAGRKQEEEEKEEIKISAYKTKYNPDYTFDSFVEGKSNKLAYNSAMAVASSPACLYNPLYFYGPSGLGKTHLMFAIINFIRQVDPGFNILYVTGEEFGSELVEAISTKKTMFFREKYRNVDILLVDDIQFIGSKMSFQEEFFHTFDTLFKSGKQIILAADSAPKDIEGLEDRLISRFSMGLVANIEPPDLELRMAIFKRKAEDYKFSLDMDVIYYLAENITTNVRQIEGALKKLKAHALITGAKCDINVAKAVLKDFFEIKKSEESIIHRVLEYTQKRFGVTEDDLKSKKRNAEIVAARNFAIISIRRAGDLSYNDIAKIFNKDRTTIMHSVEKIEHTMRTDQHFKGEIDKFLEELKK